MKILWSELKWVSSVNPKNTTDLELLRNRLEEYYKTNSTYYKDITGSENLWNNTDYLPYQAILNNVSKGSKILELGCGNAAILNYYPKISSKYNGIDFSLTLIKKYVMRLLPLYRLPGELTWKCIKHFQCFLHVSLPSSNSTFQK